MTIKPLVQIYKEKVSYLIEHDMKQEEKEQLLNELTALENYIETVAGIGGNTTHV